jgi:hypothetical protein
MPTYAAETKVTVEKSRAEIERTLQRYGAVQFAVMVSEERSAIAFVAGQRQVRFDLPMPDPNAREITMTAQHRQRTKIQKAAAYDQACRQRWRALALIIKAKLEAVESGVTTFEKEFAMHMVMPDGRVFADHAIPAIARAVSEHGVPELLP